MVKNDGLHLPFGAFKDGIYYTKICLGTFFAALRPAAEEVGEKVEDYRRRILREELGVESLSEVSRSSGFDKLMVRVCID